MDTDQPPTENQGEAEDTAAQKQVEEALPVEQPAPPAAGEEAMDPGMGEEPAAPGDEGMDLSMGEKPAAPTMGEEPAAPAMGEEPAASGDEATDPAMGEEPAAHTVGEEPAAHTKGDQVAAPSMGEESAALAISDDPAAPAMGGDSAAELGTQGGEDIEAQPMDTEEANVDIPPPAEATDSGAAPMEFEGMQQGINLDEGTAPAEDIAAAIPADDETAHTSVAIPAVDNNIDASVAAMGTDASVAAMGTDASGAAMGDGQGAGAVAGVLGKDGLQPSLLELLLQVSAQQQYLSTPGMNVSVPQTTSQLDVSTLPPLPLPAAPAASGEAGADASTEEGTVPDANVAAPAGEPAEGSGEGAAEAEGAGGHAGTGALLGVPNLVPPSGESKGAMPGQAAQGQATGAASGQQALSLSFLLPLLQQLHQTIQQSSQITPGMPGAKTNGLGKSADPNAGPNSETSTPAASAQMPITIPPLPPLPLPSLLPPGSTPGNSAGGASQGAMQHGQQQSQYHAPPRHPGPSQHADNFFCIKERNQGGLWCGRVLVTAKDCKRFPDDLRNQTQLCTSGFSTPAEAAKAVDSLLYLLGRTDKLNFPMSVDERSALDALGLGGLMAVFRNANKRATHGYFGISRVNSEGGKWRGRVHVSPTERIRFADVLQENQKQLMTNYYDTAAEAAKAVDRILFSLGRMEKLNFPMSDDEKAGLSALGLAGVMAEFRRGSHSGKTSTYRGVFRNDQKSGWVSSIFWAQRSVHLGTFAEEEEAARAYDAAAHCLGYTDKLNFPAEPPPAPNSALLQKLYGTDDPASIAVAKQAMVAVAQHRSGGGSGGSVPGSRKRSRSMKDAGTEGGEEGAAGYPTPPGSLNFLGSLAAPTCSGMGEGSGGPGSSDGGAASNVALGAFGQQLLEGFIGSLQPDSANMANSGAGAQPAGQSAAARSDTGQTGEGGGTNGGTDQQGQQVCEAPKEGLAEGQDQGQSQAQGEDQDQGLPVPAQQEGAGPNHASMPITATEGGDGNVGSVPSEEEGDLDHGPGSTAGASASQATSDGGNNASLLGQLTAGLQLELNCNLASGLHWPTSGAPVVSTAGTSGSLAAAGGLHGNTTGEPSCSTNPLAQLPIAPLDLQALIGATPSHLDMPPPSGSPAGHPHKPRGLQQQRQGNYPGVTCGVSGRWQGRAYIAASEHKLLPEHLQCLSALTTNTFDTDVEAAKALDRLLYTLGRHDKLNFPMSDDERAALDALGVGGVVAAFRREGSCRPSIRGKVSRYRGVTQCPSSARWRGLITLKRKSIHLGTFETEDDAARAYDQAARALGYLDKLNFPEEGSDEPMPSKIQLKLFGTDDPERVKQMQAASFTPTYSRRNRKQSL